MRNSPSPSLTPDDGKGEAARVSMYKAAFEEGKRALADQLSELESMRTRAVQVLAFTGSATAFLVGAGLKPDPSHRTFWFFALAIAATLVSVLGIVNVMLLLISRAKGGALTWNFRVSSKILAEQWVSPQVGAKTESRFFRDLAVHYDKMFEENKTAITWTQKKYRFVLVVCSTQIILWAALVWAFG